MDTPGDRLRRRREERGLTAAQLAERVGRSESAVRNQENGTNGIPAPLLRKYALVLGVSPGWILTGEADAKGIEVVTALPLLGPVQAGAWLEIDESSQAEPEMVPALQDRRYPHARQWFRYVQGDSMNQKGIEDGDLAHIVDFADSGLALQHGQIVEVSRYRFGGALREVTLKQVELLPHGVRLWPRSSNPLWQDPIELGDGSGQDIEVKVTGLLLRTIKTY